MANPYWTDGHGRRLPNKPCPRCGANVGPMPLRVENLRHLGWQPYTVQSYQSWCGHTQEIIPFPRADGSVVFIDVIGEASKRSRVSPTLRPRCQPGAEVLEREPEVRVRSGLAPLGGPQPAPKAPCPGRTSDEAALRDQGG
jgi:hypothetical protein